MTSAIHVWYDPDCALTYTTENYYSVSEVDGDGNEITCHDGSGDLQEAWDSGLELAKELGVPCVEFADATYQETDRWEP